MCRKLVCLISFVLVFGLAVASADPFQQDPGPDGIVSMEAENYDDNIERGGIKWEEVGPTAGFTGEAGMQALGASFYNAGYSTQSPELDYEINFVKTGTHYVWILAWAESGTDDSCHVGLDGEETPFSSNFSGGGNSWSNDRYPETDRALFEVTTTGVHVMNIWVREDGFIIDKIVLTTNPDYIPTGAGPPESHRGPRLKAYDPVPEDGALYLDTWINLAWAAGETAASHDVYFGESFDDVNDGAADTFQGNQTVTYLIVGFPGFAYPDGLVPGTTYYWRIDEVEADGTTKYKGDVWRFTIPPRKAYNPDPVDGAKFVFTDVTLSWTGGLNAKLHYVYFGNDPDVVGSAAGAPPQATTTYSPGPLEPDTTYYWRVDEFDAATTHKGDVWRFTTLPEIPITDPSLVGWWNFDEAMGSVALDWSGHDNHGNLVNGPQWVDGQLGQALAFDNSRVSIPASDSLTADLFQGSFTFAAWINPTLRGNTWQQIFRSVAATFNNDTLFINNDGRLSWRGTVGGAWAGGMCETDPGIVPADQWTHAAVVGDETNFRIYVNGALSQESAFQVTDGENANYYIGGDPGSAGESYAGMVDDARVYSRALTQDEVRETMRGEPDLAWNPNPANGSTVYITDATPLTWSPGDFAVEHDVYFGPDRSAVADAEASDTTGVYRGRQSGTSYTPSEGVEWGGGPYYWRIDEVNTDGTISKGRIWTFSVLDFLLVEDFESYTDDDANNEAIWQHWIDGFGVPDNGSQVGELLPPYAEQTIVHGGRQSMPLHYNNTAGVTNSEGALTLTAPRDWTEQGVGELSLWFHGVPASVGSFVEGPVGTYTITAEGTDIWNQADEFHYAYKTLTGGGSIEAQVLSVQNTDPWAKAGVMIRETLDAGSKFAAVYITPTLADGTAANGCRFQARTGTDASATSDTSVATAEQMAIVAPYWVKLERSAGGAFRGYYSSDGVNWKPMSWNPQSIIMSSDVYIGLALTSHSAGVVCEAKFSNVRTTGTVGGQWANQDIGIASNAAEPLYVAISNASGGPAVVANADPLAATIDAWTEWCVPLQAFADQGINLGNVDKIAVGLGSRSGMASSGGSGTMYIDDIRLYRSQPQP